jgi:aminopeptidase N
VYLRGARLLDDLRTDLGTDAFFEWLYAYADAADGQIATADLFWSLLTEDQLELTRETRERYLRQPEPTPLQDE